MNTEGLRIAATVMCVASGVLLLRRGLAVTTAWLLLACALTVSLGAMPDTSPATLFAVSLVVTSLIPALAAVAGLCWPVRPLSRIERVAAVGAVGIAGVVSGVAPALVYDTRAAGCNTCPVNLLEIRAIPRLTTSLEHAAAVLTVGWGMAVAVLAVGRWARAPRLARRHSWPMLLGGASIGLLAAAQAARSLAIPDDVFDPLAGLISNVELCLLMVVTAGIWFRLSLPRRVERRVGRAVLARTPTPATLVASLARSVGDPDLEVTYNRLNGDRIDLQGQPSTVPADKTGLRLTRDGSAYAEIWYSIRLHDTADLVHAAATSSGLALEYFAAQARLRAETLEAIEARQRIVIKADAERKRMERDLHDGAQQGLVALSVQLTTAAATASTGHSAARRLIQAQREITEALEELRAIARGLFPVSLEEAGVHAALRELGDHTLVPLVVDGTMAGQGSLETDMAIYHLVLDVVDSTRAGPDTVVRVTLEGGATAPTRILITAPPATPGWTRRLVIRSEDRLMALGGRLSVATTPAGLTFEGEIPCAL